VSRAGDERRSAALLLGPDRGAAAARMPAMAEAVRSRGVPPAPLRVAQRLAMKRGRLGYLGQSLEPMARARRAALGEAGAGPPRLLVRVDEFPRAGGFDHPGTVAEMTRFHEIMRAAAVPYLMAVTPRVARDYLNPRETASRPLSDDEAATLARLADDGVAFALHGWDHRTRRADPRRHSELGGLDPRALAGLLDGGLEALADLGVEAPVFVPPFNRFDAGQYPALAARFEVVCGGPETVALLGFHATPLWRGEAVYLPAYPPLYDRSGPLLGAVRRIAERRPGLWVPLALHLPWEADDGWRDLEALAPALAPCAAPWQDFLAAVAASRES
jgi:peptidoglycan/xylan/chitin deacetylase (PgdA/CDA1 family)